MRLINVYTRRITEFIDKVPPYAILSHRWGDEEVSFQEFSDQSRRREMEQKEGFRKILQFCRVTAAYEAEGAIRSKYYMETNKIQWVWVDTCCIDKTSSAELSEAINSMFRWYQEAQICIAYLPDVDIYDVDAFKHHSSNDNVISAYSGLSDHGVGQFKESVWFQRGWTLQELVAPQDLEFRDNKWRDIGTRKDLCRLLCSVTDIPLPILYDPARYPVTMTTVAERMKWNSRRQTSRPEDLSYCMLGLFGVNMPLLYGEGKESAFQRLQNEILRASNDESLFFSSCRNGAMLAVEPRDFIDSTGTAFEHESIISRKPTFMTNRGLQIQLALRQITVGEFERMFSALMPDETETSKPSDLEKRVHDMGDLKRMSTNNPKFKVHIAPINCWQGGYQLHVVLVPSGVEVDSYHRISTVALLKNSWFDETDMKEVFVKAKSESERYKGDLRSDMAELQSRLRHHCLMNKRVWSQEKQSLSFLSFDTLILLSGVPFVVRKDSGRETLEMLDNFLRLNSFSDEWSENFSKAVKQVNEVKPKKERGGVEGIVEKYLFK